MGHYNIIVIDIYFHSALIIIYVNHILLIRYCVIYTVLCSLKISEYLTELVNTIGVCVNKHPMCTGYIPSI